MKLGIRTGRDLARFALQPGSFHRSFPYTDTRGLPRGRAAAIAATERGGVAFFETARVVGEAAIVFYGAKTAILTTQIADYMMHRF
ncbi:MAG: hypothetical protein OXR66_08310 [Candidatus Woesearchaeota archaeon]|nr:hypothetical protein [Candidatus Woesearchaeota archaeon]